jgi:ribokinase
MSIDGFDVIVCGSLHLDTVVYTPKLPRVDETVVGTRWEQRCGGKGGNQAVMAAKAGARVAMIGRTGDDEFGHLLRSNLKAAGVVDAAVQVDSTVCSGMSAAMVHDNGDYIATIVSGANLHIDPTAVETLWRSLGGARVLVLQNEIPEPVNMSSARAAKFAGAMIVLNAAPARDMSRDLLGLVDVLIVNRVEAEMLAGDRAETRKEVLAALTKLRDLQRAAIVTLGSDGLVVASGEGDPRWVAPHVVKAVSTHGAGDCFVGTLAANLARGRDLFEASIVANDAAAAHVAGVPHP